MHPVDRLLQRLRDQGLDDLAGDLEYKNALIQEDPEELPISPESASLFADFIAREPLTGSPNLTVDSRGHVGLEWTIPGQSLTETGPGDGVLGLWFLPDGLVRICGTSGPAWSGVDRIRVNCAVPPAQVMSQVEPFLSRLEGVS